MTESERPQLWEFWERTKRELAQTALEPRQEHLPEHSTAHLFAYRVSFASLGGVRVSGYYTHPAHNPSGEGVASPTGRQSLGMAEPP